MALLSFSIITEIAVEIIGKETNGYYFLYHFFIIIEYIFITLILKRWITNKWVQKIMMISLFVFCFASLLISLFVQDFSFFPSINANIEGMLIITWCIISFFSIVPLENTAIYQLPVFWVTLAFFIYFAGTLGINGVYNHLLSQEAATAKKIYGIFNSVSNYVLYILLTIGILCHNQDRKYSALL
ncbi:hypothetical protein ESA94_05080 [Lacibacter luteus]|uniref:Uncharacterized protein n=1 Tax=Lacibacter luteus TaxID=2508719 RepID=A0A4Q1CNI1_9BACT|nr:hypothetical protein [Lacibacter luteus]RXK62384.1 hypothetical protein ESA94_05080 [Lacibacter luteus]